MSILDEVRLGRSSARHLRQLTETRCLTEADANRLLDRIERAFDSVMGAAEASRRRPALTVIDGGRA